MLPMSFIKKFKKKGVIGLYRRFVSEGIGRFRHTVIGSLLIIMFTAGFHLQAQTINLDSLLTKEELNWLQLNKDKIRYTPDPSWPPANYVEDGVHKGFVSDYICLFEQMLGVEFERVYYPTWTGMLDGLKKGETDFVGGIQRSALREEYLRFTKPFFRVELGLITRANYPTEVSKRQINSMKVACVEGYTSTYYIEEAYPSAQIVYVNNEYEALLQVVYGITDGAVVDYMTANYLVQNKGLTNLKHAVFLDYKWNLRFAARRELPELCSILGKLLDQVDEEQHQAFVSKWSNNDILGGYKHGFYESNKKIITGIFFLALFALVVVGIFNLLLRKRVNKQTTALKEAWDKVKKSEEKYKLLAENTTDLIWLSDLKLNLSYITPSVEKMLGFTPEEFLALPLDKMIPIDQVERVMDMIKEEFRLEQQDPEIEKNRSRSVEVEHFHKDGRVIWVSINATFVRDKSGKPIGLHGVTRDINEKKKTEDYIENRLAVETLLSRTSRMAIGYYPQDTAFNTILKDIGRTLNFCRTYIFEYDDKNQILSNTYEWCAEGFQSYKDNFQRIPYKDVAWLIDRLKQGKIVQYRNIEDIPDEATKKLFRFLRILSLLNVPLMIEDRFYGFIGFNECITYRDWQPENIKALESLAYIVTSMLERHKTEKEMIKKDRSIELSMIGKAIIDMEGKIIYANKACLNYWGYNALEDVLNKEVFGYWASETELRELLKLVMEKGEWQGESKAKRADGSFFDVLLCSSMVTDKNGKAICIQASIIDNTDRKAWEKELIQAKEKAEESNRLKTAFLSNISHEIRTPMSGILGFVQLLQTSDLSDKEKDEYFKSVNLSGKRLIETLNDIIEISRIESGELEIQENETDISEIIQFIRETYKPQAVEKNLQFRINTPPESSNHRFITDVYRLRRILSNLVKNAIKYTDEGSVELGASIEEDQVCFFVKDTGRGISADRTEAIFDRFVQADLNLTREHEGAGLGLSISKAYVEQLGGKILIKSKEKEGSTFSFSIPYKAPAKT